MSEPNTPERVGRSTNAHPLDVAIVGMACRFPVARDLFEFWGNVLAGRDCTREVPADRWDPAVFLDPASTANDRVYCRRGGYLDAPVEFEPTRYGVMPLAVEGGEPEQFLVLDAARAALEDAGLPDGVPNGRRAEVVIGRGNYFNRGNLTRLQHGRMVAQTLGILRALHPEWSDADLDAVRSDLKASLPPFEAGTISGQLTNATAGRVADRLDLSGASYVVDAASASSLVALDLGARALVERRADLAIVGGVYLQPDVDFPMVFCRLGALSRRGEARPFARSADGTLPGEGVGVVVLKRLADAERDGDRVYAVVKGVGLASDGRGASLAAPSARGHARALRRAYRQAGIDPATVDLVEGHGLGVPASDRAELRALRAVFPPPDRGTRTLGAVSALIGHAMPAAGIAGLIKTALALHHRVLPPTPHADDPHPLLASPDSPFSLNPAARPWVHGDESRPRRAGVNAFGFAGINAHALLEEHAPSADGVTPGCMPNWETEAVLLGAADRAGWVDLASALIAWLDAGQNARAPIKDLAYTLNTGQGGLPFRVGLVAESAADLRARLHALAGRLADPNCRSIRDAKGTYFWDEPMAGEGRLAFLFPGEGSQYPGMLADLCPHFPEVRSVLDTAERLAHKRGLERLPSEQLFGGRDRDLDGEGLWAIGTAVSVVLASQWALYQLLLRLGLRPASVVGHSSGELLAMAAAGVIAADRELDDRLGELASVFERLEAAGRVPAATLVAVAADRSRVEAACREAGGSVVIAIDNCPHQVVMAGDHDEVEAVADRLRDQGVLLETLPYRRAYHTARFAAALPPLRDFFGGLTLNPPEIPLYSCATAGRMGEDVETIRRLAVEQWVSPVAFRSTIEAMHSGGVRLFVDVGARGNLTAFVEDTLRGRHHFAAAANVPRRSGLTQLNHLVAALYAQGVPIRPDHLYARRRPRRIDLSTDLPPPRPGLALALGFPEMSLSDALVDRLRATTRPTSSEPVSVPATDGPSITPDPSHDSDRPSESLRPLPSHPVSNGKVASNGRPRAVPKGFEATPRVGHLATDPIAAEPQTQAVNRAFARQAFAEIDPPALAPEQEQILSYFKTMELFLETQRDVMEAYLRTSRGPDSGVAHSTATDGAARDEQAISPAPVPVAVEHAPHSRETSADQGDDERVKDLLLDQVSRRTGYPREMLDLDYDMEGDLGIDSIKRVEILGELQARGVVREGTELERLSRCRTLGQVLALLVRGGPRPQAPAGWVGEVERYTPGRELVAVRWLDVRDDPVASHHTLGGRRLSAVEPTRLGLPVVPFTVMAELLAQAAAVLVPGRVVVGLREVQANRWLPYDEATPLALEVHAERDPSRPDEVRVAIKNRGRKSGDDPTVVGVVVFGERREPPPVAPPIELAEAGPCRFSADELYRDQWLFHGPGLRALSRVGGSSRHGIEGTLRVLPRRELLPERLWPALHTDPIVLDAFTHLLGCWGLDKKAGEEGDVIFPLRLATLTIFGDDPPEGAEIGCRVHVREVTRHRVKVDAELVGPDGRIWVAIGGWEDWRFYWPALYRDVFRLPATILVGEPLGLSGCGPNLDDRVAAVWLEPPADMTRPIWSDVLEWVQLSPAERLSNRSRGESGVGTLGRIAAKEAARRLWLGQGEPPVYPGDLEIETGPDGRPRLRSLLDPGRTDTPALSISEADGVAVTIAALNSEAIVGIEVRRLPTNGGAIATDSLPAHSHAWLDQNTSPGAERDEWVTRISCARGALSKAVGPGGSRAVAVEGADRATGEVILRRVDLPAESEPGLVRCVTARRGEYAWAWTIIEENDR
jgi:acyl transferase domain-containing protein